MQPSLLKPKIRKLKLLRSNPTRITLYFNNDQIWFYIDDEYILSGYRPKLEILDEPEEDLSDYVKFRLWLARQLALKKFREIHEV